MLIELNDNLQIIDVLKASCKKFGNKDSYKHAKLYNKNGIQLFQDDLILLAEGDILYLGMKGKYIAIA